MMSRTDINYVCHFLRNNRQTLREILQSPRGRVIYLTSHKVRSLYARYRKAKGREEKTDACAELLNAYEASPLWRMNGKLSCMWEDIKVAFEQRGKRKTIDRSDRKCRDYYSVAVVTNEARYIREFVLFYRATGADRIYLYDNSLTDDVFKEIAPYVETGLVVYRKWMGSKVQTAAYRDAIRRTKRKTRWLALVDTDEFLFSPRGQMPDQLKVYEAYPGLGVNWLMYGPNGHDKRPEGLVMDCYTTRLPDQNRQMNSHIKSIVQPAQVSYVNHCHYSIYKGGRYAVNSEGKPIDNHYPYVINASRAFTEKNSRDIFRINHYHTKSLEDLREKSQRGYPDGSPPKPFEDQLRIYDTELVEDYSIKPYADIVRKQK